MYKNILLIITFIFLTECSLDTKTGFWTKSEILEEKKDDLKEIFKPAEILEKEFNKNLRIKINSSYKKKPFINNLSNNSGYINFHSNFKEVSNSIKFSKGMGMPGHAWETEEVQWISDLGQRNPKEFPRATMCKELGIKFAFGIPISSSGRCRDVLEIFSQQ